MNLKEKLKILEFGQSEKIVEFYEHQIDKINCEYLHKVQAVKNTVNDVNSKVIFVELEKMQNENSKLKKAERLCTVYKNLLEKVGKEVIVKNKKLNNLAHSNSERLQILEKENKILNSQRENLEIETSRLNQKIKIDSQSRLEIANPTSLASKPNTLRNFQTYLINEFSIDLITEKANQENHQPISVDTFTKKLNSSHIIISSRFNELKTKILEISEKIYNKNKVAPECKYLLKNFLQSCTDIITTILKELALTQKIYQSYTYDQLQLRHQIKSLVSNTNIDPTKLSTLYKKLKKIIK